MTSAFILLLCYLFILFCIYKLYIFYIILFYNRKNKHKVLRELRIFSIYHNLRYLRVRLLPGMRMPNPKATQEAEEIMSDTGSSLSISFVEYFHGIIKLYSDGSVVRAEEPSFNLPPLKENYEQVLYKDIVFEHTLGLWARLYLPPPRHDSTVRFPVILYFHGGGFCLFSPRTPVSHRFCLKWAADVGALIISVHYRLAPEHRLPSAYQDSVSALRWLHSQSISINRGVAGSNPWFDSHADCSKVFLMGDNA